MSSKASIVRGKAAAAAAPQEEAPRGRGKQKPAPVVEAPAPKGRGAKAEKSEPAEAAPKAPRGASRRYKLLVKENPFRAGTKRHGFWDIMTKCKTTGEVREQEPLCTTAFFDSLVERDPAIIEYLD